MQYLCLTLPDHTHIQYEETDRETYRELPCFAQSFLNGRSKWQCIRKPLIKQNFLHNNKKNHLHPQSFRERGLQHTLQLLQGELVGAGEALSHQHILHPHEKQLRPSFISMVILKTQQVLSKCCDINALGLVLHLTYIMSWGILLL